MEEHLGEINRKLDHLTDLTSNIEQLLIARHAQQFITEVKPAAANTAEAIEAAANASGSAASVETGEIAPEPQSPR